MPTIKAGAVRWDWRYAYTTASDANTREKTGKTGVHRALEHPRWQYRAPAGSTLVAPHKLSIPHDQAAMDAEIAAAAAGNLGFWWFLRYPTDAINDGLNRGLAVYQTSTTKASMPWASLESSSTLGSAGAFSAGVARLVSEMEQSHYFKVLGNRPLLGVYGNAASFAAQWGSLANFKTALDSVRSVAVAAGLGNPYLVAMIGADGATAAALGADAVTDYIGNPAETLNPTFAAQDTRTRAYWATLAGAYSKIVPVCMAGWHRGPRMERPDWSNCARTSQGALRVHGWRPYMALSTNVTEATSAELNTHVQAAITYATTNSAVCDAGIIHIYNWCENAEGGYLAPTLGVPGGKIGWLASTLASA